MRCFSEMRTNVRALVLGVMAALLMSAFVTPAMAHTAKPNAVAANAQSRAVRFGGQIMALAGQPSSPSGFTLQLRDRTLDFKILPRTTFQARSAEAYVDGFAQYDFALVNATRVNGDWTANRITYDVLPFGSIRDFTVSGKVVSLDRSGKNVLLKLLSGDTHSVRMNLNTKYQLNSEPVDTAPALLKDAALDVTVHRNGNGVWIAVTINLILSVPPH